MLLISDKPLNTMARRRSLLRNHQQITEFEVQSFLYEGLKRLGYVVRGEVMSYAQKARFDIAIYLKAGDRFPIRVIEVKRRKRSSLVGTHSGNQVHTYYEDYGIPVDLVGGMKEARRYLELIIDIVPLMPIDTVVAQTI